MMNTLDLIENDYKLLQGELKKKFTNIKDSVDRALKVIQNAKGQDPSQVSAQIDVLLAPLTMIFESKATKLYIPTLNCLQKMSQSISLSDNAIVTILTMLKDGSGSAQENGVDEMTQIRILQILLIFLNPKTLRLSKELVDLILCCIFNLFTSKSNAVRSTIQATLRQLFSIIFSQFVQTCQDHSNEVVFEGQQKRRGYMGSQERLALQQRLRVVEQEPIFRITGDLLATLASTLGQQDALTTAGGKQPLIQKAYPWNLQPSPAARAVILELLCVTLSQTGDLISFFPTTILRIFDIDIVPVLEVMFKGQTKSSQLDYSIGVRLMKLTMLIINNLAIGVNLLGYILQEADGLFTRSPKDGSIQVNLTWKSLLSFEGLALVFGNPHLIQQFSQSALQVGKTVLVQIFECLAQASNSEVLDLSGETNQRHMMSSSYSMQRTTKHIEAQLVHDQEIAPPSAAQIHKLIIEAACTFVDNFIVLFDFNGFKIGSQKQKSAQKAGGLPPMDGPSSKMPLQSSISTSTKQDRASQCRELLNLTWKPLLLVLQNLLRSTNEESNLQALLNSYQNFIGVCGSLTTKCGQISYEARDAYLDSLCSFCISSDPKAPTLSTEKQAANTVAPLRQNASEQLLSEKNIQVCKTLLNIAHCLGYMLDVRSWYIILETMQRIELVIKKSITMRHPNSSSVPVINQVTGAQTLVEFNDIRQRVQEKMREYNMSPYEPFEEEKQRSVEVKKSMLSQSTTTVHQRQLSMKDSSIQSSAQKDKNSLAQSAIVEGGGVGMASMMDINQSSDIQILQDSFDSLFTSTLLFEQQSLIELITAMGQLTVSVLESGSLGTKKKKDPKATQPNESEILASINTFAISRLVETALVNISRIEVIWKVLIAHFDILSNCRVQALRQLSLEALLAIILEVFTYRKEKKQDPTQKELGRQRSTSSGGKGSDSVDDGDMEDVDTDECWSGYLWQQTLLAPYIDQLKSSHQSNKNQTFKGMEKIIQTCGQQLKNDGWRQVILTISSAPDLNDQDMVVGTGFKCLKLIVNHYIDKLSQENFITILNAIHKYASNDGENINNNLTAVGMFQSIADYTAKRSQKQGNESVESEQVWTMLFMKTQELGSDYRAELRKANNFTLENILMTHGSVLSDRVWSSILKDSLLEMFRFSLDLLTQQRGGPAQKQAPEFELGLPTPSFSGAGWGGGADGKMTKKGLKKKMNFDDETVMKALQKNNDESWEETCILLMQTLLRTIKKYTQLDQKSSEVVNFVWTNTVASLSELIKSGGSHEICISVYKAIEDLLTHQHCMELFMNNIGTSYRILDATGDWLMNERQELLSGAASQAGPHNRKPSLLKLCPVIINMLKKVYSMDNTQSTLSISRAPYLQIYIPTFAQVLFNLLYKLLRCAKMGTASEGFQGMGVPHKLLSEEKLTFEFIEGLNDIVRKNDQTHILYLNFLLFFTEYESTEPHSEAFIRRVFSILNNIILQCKISNENLLQILPVLYDKIEYLINLRLNNEACMALVFPSKGSQTLFYTIGLYAMHFSSYLINPRHFKARMSAHYRQIQEQQQQTMRPVQPFQLGGGAGSTGGGFAGFSGAKRSSLIEGGAGDSPNQWSNDIMFQEQLEFSIVDPTIISTQPSQCPEIKTFVWGRILPLLKHTVLFNPERIVSHNKAVIEEVVKSSQDLDMQVMNFITNSLLPNYCGGEDKDFQATLVQIIDNGCNSVYSSSRLTTQTAGAQSQGPTGGAFGNTLSKYCLNNLFELCRYQQMTEVQDNGDSISPSSPSQQKHIHDIKKRIATLTTPVLITRCRETLRKYASDELKSGNMTLPRQRVSEAAFILEKLRLLDVYPEMNNFSSLVTSGSLGVRSKKGHLVSLMPIFADLIMSNEASLKEHLRLIFLDISEAITAQNTPTPPLYAEIPKVGDSSGGEY